MLHSKYVQKYAIDKFVALGSIVTICTVALGVNQVLVYKAMDFKFNAMKLKLEAVHMEVMNN